MEEVRNSMTNGKHHVLNTGETTNTNTSKQKISRNNILDYIRTNAPLTIYKLAKDLKLNYSTAFQVVKEFEFAGLIETNYSKEDNRTQKIITIPKVEDKGEENESN